MKIKYKYATEDITLDEANEKLRKTTVFFYQRDNGKYLWHAIMSESPYGFDTLKEAYDDAVDYLNSNGY